MLPKKISVRQASRSAEGANTQARVSLLAYSVFASVYCHVSRLNFQALSDGYVNLATQVAKPCHNIKSLEISTCIKVYKLLGRSREVQYVKITFVAFKDFLFST